VALRIIQAQMDSLLGKHCDRPALSDTDRFLLVIAFSSLVISQFGTKAHENHTYPALVLMLPIVARYKSALWVWCGMTMIHFYLQMSSRGFGLSLVLPKYEHIAETATAIAMADAISSRFPAGESDAILDLQRTINEFLREFDIGHYPPFTWGWPLLSFIQAVLSVWMIWYFLRLSYSAARGQFDARP
jgi:hypothetical protein